MRSLYAGGLQLFLIVSTASPTDLSILETMHIHKEKPTLNIHQQATELLIIT